MRIKELNGCIDSDVKAVIVFVDADAWEDGNMGKVFAKYGDYYVKEMLPILDVVAQVPKLKIVAITPIVQN